MDVEMEDEFPENQWVNGDSCHLTNGHARLNGHVQLNGYSVNDGLRPSGNGDVLLIDQVARNIVPIAGRKRGREEIDDEPCDDLKRMCRSQCNGATGQLAGVVHSLPSSISMETVVKGPSALIVSPRAAHTARAPIVRETHYGQNFFCSHKYKNAPCI